MTTLFTAFLNMSLTASYVAIAVIVFRYLLHKVKVPKIFSYILWLAVAFRLVVPISFSSAFSLMGILKPSIQTHSGALEYIPSTLTFMQNPEIDSGSGGLNAIVNSLLPSATPTASVNPLQLVMELATIIWLVGIAILLIYSLIAYGRILQRVRVATLVRDHIFESGNIAIPFVCGLFRPRIFIPLGLQENELNYILAHEQIHIKRLDFVVKPLAFFVLILHWYNPLVWLSFALMSKDMEMSCDERVLKDMGNKNKSGYARSLLALSLQRSGLPMGSTIAFGESHIKSRIKNIMGYKKPTPRVLIVPLLIMLTLIVACTANPKNTTDSHEPVPSETTYDFQSLIANKTPYIGDNSKVIALLDALAWPQGVTRDTLELQTSIPPYGLHVNLLMTDATVLKEARAIDVSYFYPQAALLFSLIDTLDSIQFTLLDSTGDYDGASYSTTFTRESIEHQLGKAAGSYAYSENTLQELLQVIQTTPESTTNQEPILSNSTED